VASFFCSLSSANAPLTEWRIDGPMAAIVLDHEEAHEEAGSRHGQQKA
jgi:hypothetical protein